jgi:hypothetical protein
MNALPELQVVPKANDNYPTGVITCVANAFTVIMKGDNMAFESNESRTSMILAIVARSKSAFYMGLD